MANNDPEIKSLLETLGARNPRDLFYIQARRQGMTDDQIVAFLKDLAKRAYKH